MAKDPAFLFYPNDWLGGTMGMTFEEKGAYLELLIMQFNRGHMSGHMVGHMVGQLWDKISHKFKQDSEGNWYNERVEIEIEKRKKFTNSRKNNLLGKNQHKKGQKMTSHMEGHVTSHMENENENRNENKDINETLWINIKSKFENDFRFEEHFCRVKNISLIDFRNMRNEFLNDIELRSEYKELKELKNHFTNWSNKKIKSNAKSKLSANTSENQRAMEEYLNRYR